jgi:competence ComEA-like helix-hairpin-helix protein
MWKRFLHDYFSFTHKERRGILVLSGLIILFIALPFLFPLFHHQIKYDHTAFDKEVAQLKLRKIDSVYSDKKYKTKNYDAEEFNDFAQPSEKNYSLPPASEVFYFDPNTATNREWKRLGVKDKTIETIQKYLSKGGRFYKAEDINKIWGLHPNEIKRLLPYVRIEQQKIESAENQQQIQRRTYAPKVIQPIDINSADTTAFISLPGIGSKLAQRIINFREKLGGFYAIDQVSETFGLPDSTFQKIKSRLTLTNLQVKKININTASLDEMKAHPYIRYPIANAILQYKTQHGNFSFVNDLKKIMLVTEDIYKKVEPYIAVE